MRPLHTLLDALAVVISGLCALHCLALPVLLVFFPLLFGSVLTDEDFHRLVLWIILPTSVIAVAAARYRHPSRQVLIWVGSGMALLLLAAFWAHDYMPAWADIALTTLGGLMLAVGHIRNIQLSRHH